MGARKPVRRTWDEIAEKHPHVYGEESGDGDGIGDAASHLAHSRPSDPDAEGHSVHDLEFESRHVDPKHVDYARTGDGLKDSRVKRAYDGFKRGARIPPAVLVHRHGVYQVADGHHRAEAAHLAGVKLPAYVAHSPYPDDPHSHYEDGETTAPYHGAEPIDGPKKGTVDLEKHIRDYHMPDDRKVDKARDGGTLHALHDEVRKYDAHWRSDDCGMDRAHFTAPQARTASEAKVQTPPRRRKVASDDSMETLDLYHRTTPEAAAAIHRTKRMTSQEQGRVFFSTHRDGGQGEGYGDAVVHVRVPEHLANLDDEFPSGEQHYWVHQKHLRPQHFIQDGAR